MENTNTPATNGPAPVTPVELLTRQLSDWHALRANLLEEQELERSLERSDELTEQIAYCEAKTNALAADLQTLMNR